MQLVLTIFYIFWLIAVPGLLFLIFLVTFRYIRGMESTMLASRAIEASAALKSAETTAKVVAILEEKEHHA